MKTFALTTAILFATLTAFGQKDILLFGEDRQLADQSYGGKYTGHLFNDEEMIRIDESGLITGKHLTFYEGGAVESSGMYLRGEKHGAWSRYAEDGTILSQGYFTDGKKDGNWKVWDENGTLRAEMNYKNGARVKTWKIYNAEGELTEEKNYDK